MPATTNSSPDLLPGTLDMLILKVLTPGGSAAGGAGGSNHGYGIARRIRQLSDEVLHVEEGSLYPALHRLARRGLIQASWGLSESNRRARYYRLTPRGRAALKSETEQWTRMSTAIGKVLNARVAHGAAT